MAHTDVLRDRPARARRLLSSHAQWLKLRDRQGRPLAYGIESERRVGFYHLANTRQCTCPDFSRGNVCKHVFAVRMLVEQKRNERTSAAKVVPFRRTGTDPSSDVLRAAVP
jgi:SWIM zinc finger